MKKGHFLALLGAVLVLVGAAVLPWQTFHLAGLTALGYQVPPAGQVVAGLAGLIALTSLLGLLTRKRKQFATASLIVSCFLIGWLVVSHVLRSSEMIFELQKYEVVEMAGGYTLAVWGAFLIFFGALVVLAAEPAMDPKAQFLRVALVWGDSVIQERILQEPQTFRVGEDLHNDFIVPAPKLRKKFPLFRAGPKGQYDLGLTTDLEGEVTINQKTMTVSEAVGQATYERRGAHFLPVTPGDWGMVHLGDLGFFFQFVQPDTRVSKRGFMAFDENVVAAVAISFIIQLTLLMSTVFLWQEDVTRVVKRNQRKPLHVAAVINQKDKEELEEEDAEDDSTAKKAEDEEGKFGDPEEEPEKESKVPKNEGRMVDKIDPKKVGLNDLLSTNKLGGEGAIANILNADAQGFSNKIAIAMAGTGTEFVMGYGSGGLGFRGTGSGGGGEGGYGRIHGMGKFDTGGGMGVKAGLGKKGSKRVGKMRVGSGATQGFCKTSNISSVVRRRAGAIRACYEARLQIKPKLSGKLTARWTISLDGKVQGSSITGDSLGDSSVANCVLRVLRRMRFAKPEGGICVVRWPFVFSPGD